MKTSGKEILYAALRLFSERGYDGVSIREIASAVGIRESSLYNHYPGKKALFDALVEECWSRAKVHFQDQGLPFSEEDDLSPFEVHQTEALARRIWETFSFFFDDEWNVRFRKLLTMSASNPEMRALYRELYHGYPLRFQRALFERLMARGFLRKADPDALAALFYGPIFMMVNTCEDPKEAREKIERHVQTFMMGFGGEEIE